MPAGPSQNQSQWAASMILSALLSGTIVAGGFNLSFLLKHPWESVGIIVALLVLVAIYSIATGLFGKLRDPIINWLSRQILGEDGRFEREYLKSVASSVRTFETKGIPYDDMGSLSMAKLFVDPGVAERDSKDRQGLLPDVAAPGSARGTLDSLIETDGTDRIIAVIGVPGSGKTTLLRHAAARACEQSRPRLKRPGHSARLPILLSLRDHVTTIAADPHIPITDLETPLLRAKPALKDWLKGKLDAGQCVVLLDGLDEVAQPEDRARVAGWVQGLTTTFSGCRFVISSRPGGYQGNPIDGAKEFRVCGFTSEQVRVFLRRWYGEPEPAGTSSGTASGTTPDTTNGEADQLWHLLQTRPAIYDLAANPLLLTMIAAVHGQKGTLPDNRAALYQDICSVVLWTRAQAKGQKFPLNEKQKTAVLAEIAYAMMHRQRSDLSTADVETIIEPLLSRMARMGDVISPAAFLAQANSDGLLGEREAGYHGFAHKTFQEYLAAVHIRDTRPDTDPANDLVGDLLTTVSDQWWTETSIFYAAIANADRLVTACLDAQTTTALALACECADVAHALSTDLRAKIDKLLADASDLDHLASREPAEIQQLAGVLLARHLRQRVQTSAGTQVCVLPITAEVYQMFLAAKRVPAPDAPASRILAPAVSEVSRDDKKTRDKKVVPLAVGMRDTDAAEFCGWANGVPDRQVSYRLPNPAELDELDRQQRIQALPAGSLPRVWTQSPERRIYPHLLPSAGGQQATSIDLADVAKRDLADPGFFLGPHLVYARTWVKMFAGSLARTLARTLDLTPGPLLDGAFDHALDNVLSSDIASALKFAYEHDHSFDFNLDGACDFARAQADRVARAINLDSRVSLDRARTLDRFLGAASSNAFDLAVILARDLVCALDHHLRVIVRDLTRSRAFAFGGDVGRAFALASALVSVLGRDFGRADTKDLVPVFILVRALDRALFRVSMRASTLERGGDLGLEYLADPVHLGPVVMVPIDQFDLAAIKRAAEESLGTALAGGLSKISPENSSIQQRATLFAEEFCSISDVPSRWLLPEDHLVRDSVWEVWLPEFLSLNAERLNSTTAGLSAALDRQPGDHHVAWVKAVSKRLVANATPIFNRAERCTSENAFAIRLAALCLAAEADRRVIETHLGPGRYLGDKFRDIAAGITWLEQRHSGEIPATEVIMLAVE